MNYKNKNVLIIGFGSIGQRHAKILVDMSVNVFVYSRRKIDFKSSFSCLEKSLEKINYDYIKFLTKTFWDDLENERFLQSGDILWNSTGQGTIGRASIFFPNKIKKNYS